MISVIIPSYNRSDTILRAVDSVLNQTYSDIELLVVDDGSTDDTLKVLSDIKDSRLTIIKTKENNGATYARNLGIDQSKGEYIAFQDSDDLWYPNKLQKQLDFIRSSKADIVACAMKSKEVGKNSGTCTRNLGNHGELITSADLLPQNFISTQTILGKKKVFLEEKFDEQIPRYQDWELMLRITKKFKVYFDNEVLVDQFIQKDSITKNMDKSFFSLNKIIEANRDILDNDKAKMAGMLYWLGLSKRAMKENSTPFFRTSLYLKWDIMTLVRLIMSLYNI
ncbi:glycosyltransferase family 2 protein [Candidatus Enterococcus ikei]|uniref:Glycosyltransferase family 2 protein n=1 Tax=Candidatus Enterococcus ikei TaxID=2815326 RepID=A0ABS3GZM8_9ENTE|nr:glycosyltransferase [Enterococcus sp. DIV0869a]MBO0440378.1 glycosyltransferase family 2 protein [Enterococcus sp. DIV0869a]